MNTLVPKLKKPRCDDVIKLPDWMSVTHLSSPSHPLDRQIWLPISRHMPVGGLASSDVNKDPIHVQHALPGNGILNGCSLSCKRLLQQYLNGSFRLLNQKFGGGRNDQTLGETKRKGGKQGIHHTYYKTVLQWYHSQISLSEAL